MKNKEKYAEQVLSFACDRYNSFGIYEGTGEIGTCETMRCKDCMFYKLHNSCRENRRKWLESEHIEKPVISKKDKAFLEYLKEEYKYIARDKNDVLYAYNAEPCKARESWNSGCSDYWFRLNHRFDINFPMVKWSDEEPWLIKDLKKLEVVEEYEENSR